MEQKSFIIRSQHELMYNVLLSVQSLLKNSYLKVYIYSQVCLLPTFFEKCEISQTRLKMSNPYPHDVHIYVPNFKPNYVNRERGECEIYRCVMNEEIILYDQIQYV